MAESKSPSFSRPPVVETVVGVQFEPVQGLTNAHLGAFWSQLGPEWPHVSDAATLEPVYELFGDAQPWLSNPGIRMMISQNPSTRLRIKNENQDRMIQVQDGRIHYNWLGQSGGSDYPRFDNVFPDFEKTYEGFRSFVSKLGLGEVKPNQWEVTYVNHIPKDTVWTGPQDVGAVFPKLLASGAEISAGALERQEAEWHFEIEPQRGRLHIALKHAERSTPKPIEILVLTLTARGSFRADLTSIADDLDVGHRAIVEAFDEITAPHAHEYWRRNV